MSFKTLQDVLDTFKLTRGSWVEQSTSKFYCNDSKITEFEIIDTKNSSTAYVVMYKFIT